MQGTQVWSLVGELRSRMPWSNWACMLQLGREGNGNPLQYSCLENTMDRGGWWAIVHNVTQSDTIEWLNNNKKASFLGMNPLRCSCLENPRGGGAWWAAVSGVAQSQTGLKRLSSREGGKGAMCDLANSFRLANELVSSLVKKRTISFNCCKKNHSCYQF